MTASDPMRLMPVLPTLPHKERVKVVKKLWPALAPAVGKMSDKEWQRFAGGVVEEISAGMTDAQQRHAMWRPNPGPQTMAYESQADILGYGGSGGGGKALALDTKLPTPTGWTTMGDVATGDWLLDEKGQPCRVVGVSEVMLNRPCYRVEFSDGAQIVADAGHIWVTTTEAERRQMRSLTPEFRAMRRAKLEKRGSGKRPDLAARNSATVVAVLSPPTGGQRTTQEIYETLKKGKATNHAVAVCAPLALPPVDLPIDPYVLGAWLGDGTSAAGAITTPDLEIITRINIYYDTRHRVDYTHGIYGLQAHLRKNGLLKNKHIPPAYLRGSVEQRLALLHGLMDTDGYCDTRGQCEFTSINRLLAEGMRELLGTLGIKAAITTGRAMLNGKDCGEKYRIKFMTELPAFSLPRKLAPQKRSGFRGTHNRRYIVEVEPVASVPVKCVAVDAPSRLYLAGEAFIPTHNSDLLLGLAATQHHHSVIFRRVFPNLRALIERSRGILNPESAVAFRDRFNESLHRWVMTDGRMIEFEACQYEKDKEKQRGRPRDFYGFDEATEFTRTQVEFITAWLRSTRPGQRCRVILTFNPPSSDGGAWVIDYFKPWLAYLHPETFTHPNPAQPGELRWFATIDGKEVECADGTPFVTEGGEQVKPLSRTFIPARLDDNPYLSDTNYRSVLQSLPEPLRSQMLYGDFAAAAEDDPWQVIPTAWVKLAQDRWARRQRPYAPLSAVGVDCARGGQDKTTIARRYDNWVDEVLSYPGKETPTGPIAAEKVRLAVEESQAGRPASDDARRLPADDQALINVDVIGVGASAFDSLKPMFERVRAVNVSEKSEYRDRSGKLKMRNVRAEIYWRMREALDPEHGDDLALPPGAEVVADLCAPRYTLTTAGIQIEPKEAIKERIGRSPDVGDALCLTFAPEITFSLGFA